MMYLGNIHFMFIFDHSQPSHGVDVSVVLGVLLAPAQAHRHQLHGGRGHLQQLQRDPHPPGAGRAVEGVQLNIHMHICTYLHLHNNTSTCRT